jgi:hypothetical protein
MKGTRKAYLKSEITMYYLYNYHLFSLVLRNGFWLQLFLSSTKVNANVFLKQTKKQRAYCHTLITWFSSFSHVNNHAWIWSLMQKVLIPSTHNCPDCVSGKHNKFIGCISFVHGYFLCDSTRQLFVMLRKYDLASLSLPVGVTTNYSVTGENV